MGLLEALFFIKLYYAFTGNYNVVFGLTFWANFLDLAGGFKKEFAAGFTADWLH
jgi:hypothetical protein